MLASVVLALAVYQLLLAAVAYGWLRLPFLESHPASWAHRASGDAIVVLTVLIAVACLSYYGLDGGRRPPQAAQMVGSLLAALAIVAIAIWVVTNHFGPTSTAKLEAQEERLDQRIDAREEARKQREDAREEGGGSGDNSGSG